MFHSKRRHSFFVQRKLALSRIFNESTSLFSDIAALYYIAKLCICILRQNLSYRFCINAFRLNKINLIEFQCGKDAEI